MDAQINLRVTKDFKTFVEEEAAKRKLNKTELIINAVTHFSRCGAETGHRREYFGPGLREIVTKYPGQCSKCKDPIPVGTRAWYGKREKSTRPVLVCLNCMVLGMGDTTLARKYLKKRELEVTIRGLKKIADELRKERGLRNQLFDWLMGGAIGFFISLLLNFLLAS